MGLLNVIAGSGGAPDTPTIGTATGGDAQATVAFTVPSYTGKGGAVTYRALSTPDSVEATGSGTPITVTSLTNGVSYTFQVRTETSYGANSAYSTASNAVTPVAPPVPTPTPTPTPPAPTPPAPTPPAPTPPAPTPPAPTPPAPTPPAPTPPAPTPPAPTPPAPTPCVGCGNCQFTTGVCPSDPDFLATFETCYDSCGNVCTNRQVGLCFN